MEWVSTLRNESFFSKLWNKLTIVQTAYLAFCIVSSSINFAKYKPDTVYSIYLLTEDLSSFLIMTSATLIKNFLTLTLLLFH